MNVKTVIVLNPTFIKMYRFVYFILIEVTKKSVSFSSVDKIFPEGILVIGETITLNYSSQVRSKPKT